MSETMMGLNQVQKEAIKMALLNMVDELLNWSTNKQRNVSDDCWMSCKEAASYVSCSEQTIKRAISSGKLASGSLDKRLRIRRSSIDNWLESGTEKRQEKATQEELAAQKLFERFQKDMPSATD